MKPWLVRNTKPITIVLIASALVIGLFEIIDAFAEPTPVVAETEEAGLEGLASLAGLIKVTAFLLVGSLIAIPIRRRFVTAGS